MAESQSMDVYLKSVCFVNLPPVILHSKYSEN